MQTQNKLFKILTMRVCVSLCLISSIFLSCSLSNNWHFKEVGTLLWVDSNHKDMAVKSAIQYTLEHSSIIVAQIPWSPNDSVFFKNTAWYFSLAKDHGKNFMIAIDWQENDRTGTKGGWSFADRETAILFKKDMLKLVETYNPDYINLGVEVNYYALTSSNGFKAFASMFRELKQEIKELKPGLKIGLSYQLELLYGHHNNWDQSKTFITLDNLLGDIDYLGISTYPNMVSEIKRAEVLFSIKYIDSLSNAYSLPIGISETAVSSKLYNKEQRNTYVKNIFQKVNELDLKFVIWGSMIDGAADNFWSDKMGLLNADGEPKNEFSFWQNEYSKLHK